MDMAYVRGGEAVWTRLTLGGGEAVWIQGVCLGEGEGVIKAYVLRSSWTFPLCNLPPTKFSAHPLDKP